MKTSIKIEVTGCDNPALVKMFKEEVERIIKKHGIYKGTVLLKSIR